MKSWARLRAWARERWENPVIVPDYHDPLLAPEPELYRAVTTLRYRCPCGHDQVVTDLVGACEACGRWLAVRVGDHWLYSPGVLTPADEPFVLTKPQPDPISAEEFRARAEEGVARGASVEWDREPAPGSRAAVRERLAVELRSAGVDPDGELLGPWLNEVAKEMAGLWEAAMADPWEEARALVEGEPHVCTCGHNADGSCEGCSEGFEDRCRFEAMLRRLVA